MRIFTKIVPEGSFAAAARKLDVGVPVASRALMHLESHLGTRLLKRTTRQMALPEKGERYLLNCQQILSSLDDAETEARTAMGHPTERLHVHALSSFGHQPVMPALLSYQQRYPTVRVDLKLSGAMRHMLNEGYDVSIVLAPELPGLSLVSAWLGSMHGGGGRAGRRLPDPVPERRLAGPRDACNSRVQ